MFNLVEHSLYTQMGKEKTFVSYKKRLFKNRLLSKLGYIKLLSPFYFFVKIKLLDAFTLKF